MRSTDKNETENVYKIFKPQLTPKKMMELGVFGGSYFGNKTKEFDFIVSKYLSNIEKFIFICPEYNGSIPGVLKSFIDCTNYKLYKSKKISLVGLSSGRAGNLRGLDHLTSILHHLGSEVFSLKPIFSNIHEFFQNDELINKQYLKEINNHLDSFNKF